MKVTVLIKNSIILFIFLLLPLISFADINEDIELFSNEIEEFIGDNTAIIFIGEYASPSEKLTLKYLQENHPKSNEAEIFYNPNDLENVNLQDKTLILVGSSKQNSISKQILEENHTKDIKEMSIGLIYYITTEDGKKYIIFSDRKSASTNPNTSIKNSPLKGFVPEEFIPATAVVLGVSLLWLWHLLGSLFFKIGRLFVSEKIMGRIKKKEANEKSKSFKLFGLKIKYRELFSVIGASIVFALIVTYTYFSKEIFIALLISNVIINAVIYGSRNLARLLMDKKYGNHTEYKFWIYGAIVTLLTGWFGYTMSMAGYITKHKDDKNENQGFISFVINFVTFFVGVIFFILNLIYPNLIFQMASVLSVSIAFIQMMPFKPFSGINIFKWRKLAWFGLIIIMLPTYVIINLI